MKKFRLGRELFIQVKEEREEKSSVTLNSQELMQTILLIFIDREETRKTL
jgi:hypothetical protein